ncbi:hypothetical protein KSS87_001907 [Heliosperma pusillum]|nr:hypothetical protein KSS87_001907 [Heliosperma pusillum]
MPAQGSSNKSNLALIEAGMWMTMVDLKNNVNCNSIECMITDFMVHRTLYIKITEILLWNGGGDLRLLSNRLLNQNGMVDYRKPKSKTNIKRSSGLSEDKKPMIEEKKENQSEKVRGGIGRWRRTSRRLGLEEVEEEDDEKEEVVVEGYGGVGALVRARLYIRRNVNRLRTNNLRGIPSGCPGISQGTRGCPANVVIAVARMGGAAGFAGKLGAYEFGWMLAGILKENGVNVEGICFDEAARTALTFVTLKADGEREFMFYRNPNADMLLRPDELNLDLIRKVCFA